MDLDTQTDAQFDSDSAERVGCGCLSFLLQNVAIIVLVSNQFGLGTGALVAVSTTVTSWLLALTGIIPFWGQTIYKQNAEGIIASVYRSIGVNPSFPLIAPDWVNFTLKWILGGDEVIGTITSYAFAAGYALSIAVSFTVVGSIILIIFRKWLR